MAEQPDPWGLPGQAYCPPPRVDPSRQAQCRSGRQGDYPGTRIACPPADPRHSLSNPGSGRERGHTKSEEALFNFEHHSQVNILQPSRGYCLVT